MKKQWLFMTLMAAMVILSSLSIPMIAGAMIESDVDKVQVERRAATIVAADERQVRKTTGDAAEIKSYPINEAALAKLKSAACDAYEATFGQAIPDDYSPLDASAYEDEGDMRYVMSLMPAGWEDSVSPLPTGETTYYFYTILFGGVDVETGDAQVLGMQRYRRTYDESDEQEAEYTTEQRDDMERRARAFAESIGLEPGAVVVSTKVSGSYEPGMIFGFDLGDGKSVEITVPLTGEVNGYSFIPGKG